MLWKPACAPDRNLMVEQSVPHLLFILLWNNYGEKCTYQANIYGLVGLFQDLSNTTDLPILCLRASNSLGWRLYVFGLSSVVSPGLFSFNEEVKINLKQVCVLDALSYNKSSVVQPPCWLGTQTLNSIMNKVRPVLLVCFFLNSVAAEISVTNIVIVTCGKK